MDQVSTSSYTKQQLGAFYTPERLTRLLTDWAIRAPDDTVLDPSYGGCAFFASSLASLHSFGSPNPARQIYGVDVDPQAKAYLYPLIEAGASPTQFHTKNFFDTTPQDFSRRFDCIVGNPPYISHHDMPAAHQVAAAAQLQRFGITLSGRASSWAYFVAHSLSFLADGGRLAMVVPSALLYADYAAELKELLVREFRQVTILLLRERVFTDTPEQAVILLADGFGEGGTRTMVVSEAVSLAELEQRLTAPSAEAPQPRALPYTANLYQGLLPPKALAVRAQYEAHPAMAQVSDWFDVRIGVVTGANAYFIKSGTAWRQLGIPIDVLTPIIRRFGQLPGLSLEQHTVDKITASSADALLLTLDADMTLPEPIQRYISTAPDKVKLATKCVERKPWYAVHQRFSPDCFFQYMADLGPRLVVNHSNATCTNNIHRLTLHQERAEAELLSLALGSLTSLCQLSAELLGRTYGGGVLKLEPTALKQLSIPLHQDVPADVYASVDAALRRRDMAGATELADEAVLLGGLGMSNVELQIIREARNYLMQRRRRTNRA